VWLLSFFPAYRRYVARCLSSRAAAAAEAAFYAPRKQTLFARLAALGPGAHVVDVGAGAGVNVKYLPPNVTRVTFVEPNTALVSLTVGHTHS
jgi:protein-L-isoaspartate O-methyltransferase